MTGRALRVGPGDEVVVRARLPAQSSKLSRLFVFAKPVTDEQFAPYVPQLPTLVDSLYPSLQSMLSLRLTQAQPARELKFTADINGRICIMQEIDIANEPRARVQIARTVCPDLPWYRRLQRWLVGFVP